VIGVHDHHNQNEKRKKQGEKEKEDGVVRNHQVKKVVGDAHETLQLRKGNKKGMNREKVRSKLHIIEVVLRT